MLCLPSNQCVSFSVASVLLTSGSEAAHFNVANYFAIHSLGESLVQYLQRAYDEEKSRRQAEALEPELPACNFVLIGSEGMSSETGPSKPAVSLYLYRVTVNEHLRNQPRSEGVFSEQLPPIGLDLHYLLSVWMNDAAEEYRILGWVIAKLYARQVLGESDLSAEGGWEKGELIHLIPSELSNEDLMRVWDALKKPYHLSLSYIARVVRIQVGAVALAPKPPVVAKRLSFGKREDMP